MFNTWDLGGDYIGERVILRDQIDCLFHYFGWRLLYRFANKGSISVTAKIILCVVFSIHPLGLGLFHFSIFLHFWNIFWIYVPCSWKRWYSVIIMCQTSVKMGFRLHTRPSNRQLLNISPLQLHNFFSELKISQNIKTNWNKKGKCSKEKTKSHTFCLHQSHGLFLGWGRCNLLVLPCTAWSKLSDADFCF